MERAEILAKIADIAADVLGVDMDGITEATTFDDLEADSLDRLQLVTAMEDEFDIEFAEESLASIASVSDAIDAVEKALEQALGNVGVDSAGAGYADAPAEGLAEAAPQETFFESPEAHPNHPSNSDDDIPF